MLSPDEEQSRVEQVMAVMNQDDPLIARRVLRKWNGDVERAITAMLSGDTAVDEYPPTRPQSPRHGRAGQPSPVIDLTGETESETDIQRAVKASLEPLSATFGPSERAADPNWAMVPSSSNGDVSHEDHNLHRAIAASIHDVTDLASDTLKQPPLEEQFRIGGRPVAMRPTSPTIVYAALLIHGLYYVPQVRERIARWRHGDPPASGPEHLLWTLLELFAYLDYMALAEMNCDEPLSPFQPVPWTPNSAMYNKPLVKLDAGMGIGEEAGGGESLGDLSFSFLHKVASTIEPFLKAEPHRLFHFRYGDSRSLEDDMATKATIGTEGNDQETFIVKVTVSTTPSYTSSISPPSSSTTPAPAPPNDLISQLSAQLSQSNQKVILDPSEVVAFQLVGGRGLPGYSQLSSSPSTSTSTSTWGNEATNWNTVGGGTKKRFTYPKSLYLDQFLAENAELASEKRRVLREMGEEVRVLGLKRGGLVGFKGKDTLKDLRSSIYYYEHVATAGEGDVERKEVVEGMARKLGKVLERVEGEVKAIDERIAQLVHDSACLFDSDDLKKHKYDLRAVFIHDGLFGRRNVYSYVQEKGIWWKVLDNEVTEVSEDVVLDDPAGLHLGAGPYMLLYSRALSPEEEAKRNDKMPWPEKLKDSIKYNNTMFLRMLPPEKAALVQPMSPMSSPNAFAAAAAAAAASLDDGVGQPDDMDLSAGVSQDQAESSQMVVDAGGV